MRESDVSTNATTANVGFRGLKLSKPADIFTHLSRHAVPYVVVGGHAVNFHGYLRATEDVDIVVLRSEEADRQLLAALQEINAKWISDEIDPATGIEKPVPVSASYLASQHVMMLCTDLGYLDVFDYIPGLPREDVRQLFESAVEHDGIRFASLEWLKRMKTAAGRHRDLDDLEQLGLN